MESKLELELRKLLTSFYPGQLGRYTSVAARSKALKRAFEIRRELQKLSQK